MTEGKGFQGGLTNYGDKDFASYLRRSFVRSMGLSREMLEKPIVGIAMTPIATEACQNWLRRYRAAS